MHGSFLRAAPTVDSRCPTVEAPAACIEPLERRTLLSSLEGFGAVRADGNELATDQWGTVHRIWRDPFTGDLRYAVRNADEFWSSVTTIDPGWVGVQMAIAIDSRGRPNVSYYDQLNGNLMFARREDGAWIRQVVDSPGDVGDFSSIRLERNGTPHISYYDRTNGNLKVATLGTRGQWSTTVVDSEGDVGRWSSMTGDNTALYVAYTDVTNKAIRLAVLPSGGVWSTSEVDTGSGGFDHLSIALDPATGTPHIAYRDVAARGLKLAIRSGAGWTFRTTAPGGDEGYYAAVTFATGQPTVVHYNKLIGTVDRTTFGPGAPATWTLALAGYHISVAPAGKGLVFDRVDAKTGMLYTSRSKFEYVLSSYPSQRIMHWETIGGSSNDISKRRVGWSLDTIGWSGYYAGRIAPLRAFGLRRLLLHNPFGTLPDEGYQVDQYLHAQQAGLTWLTNGFVQTWKPVVDSGVEVIAYIGSLWDDPDFIALENNPRAYMQRIMASIKPFMDSGMSIGLDSIVYQGANTYSMMFAEMLRQSGIRVYAENRPPLLHTWWHNYDGIYHDLGYDQSQPHLDPVGTHTAPNYLLRGEIVRWTADPPPGFTFEQLGWRGPAVVRILSENNTAATDLEKIRREGWTLQQLYHLATFGTGGRPAPAATSEMPDPQEQSELIDELLL